jgi:hypothetical protein
MIYDSNLQSSTVTPFDFSEYVQALRNPIGEYSTQSITVQVVHPNVTYQNRNLPAKDLLNPMKCPKGDDLELI